MKPVTTIGILGAGQLGRMLALAGYPLGLRFRFLDPAVEAPAEHLARRVIGAYEDLEPLQQFAAGLDLVTYEFENVPVSTARFLEQRLPVFPPPMALEVAQDRLIEKTFFQKAGLATAPFAAVDSREDLAAAVSKIGLPGVLKTRRYGYDGKGQVMLHRVDDVTHAWERLGGTPLILEGFVPFEREVSLLAVRGRSGQTAFYPLVENHHREGMLRLSLAPAPGLTDELQAEAEALGQRVLEGLGYVGVLAIEFFQVSPRKGKGARLMANEMAPRVHNSGHWTIEGAETSQFENHLRAVLGLPLGKTALLGCSAMVNLIGTIPDSVPILAIPGAHLHLYGKAPRPGRKLGHLTLRCPESRTREQALDSVKGLIDF
jgi:5-(carboxyamino)imidazole ribonucleotide synthase